MLPEYRKKGILTEMAAYRLNEAKKLNFNTNVVQCMPESASVYDKLQYKNKDMLNLYSINSEAVEIETGFELT